MRFNNLPEGSTRAIRVRGAARVEEIEGPGLRSVFWGSYYLTGCTLGGGRDKKTKKRYISICDQNSFLSKTLRNYGFQSSVVTYLPLLDPAIGSETDVPVLSKAGLPEAPGIVYGKVDRLISRDYGRVLMEDGGVEGCVSGVWTRFELAISAMRFSEGGAVDDTGTFLGSMILVDEFVVLSCTSYRDACDILNTVLNKPWGEAVSSIKTLSSIADEVVMDNVRLS